MNCSQVREYLDSLLVEDRDRPTPADILVHIETCQACPREYKNAQETFAALQLSRSIHAPNKLKEQIMSQVISANVLHPSLLVKKVSIQRHFWFRVLAAAAALAAIIFVYSRIGRSPSGPEGMSAAGLIAQAWASEKSVFDKPGIVHVVNRIVVKAITDTALAKMRWLPYITLDAKGGIHINQLNLPAEPGEEYAVSDEIWYESSTGRYIHIVRDKETLAFANSFDGKELHTLERAADGVLNIGSETAPDFQPPHNPVVYLGMGSAFGGIDDKNLSLFSDQGWHTLPDGTPVRVLKRQSGADVKGAPPSMQDSYALFKIGENNAIAEIEWVVNGQSWLTIRRELVENVQAPDIPWDLSGIKMLPKREVTPQVAITKDMVLPDASVQQMLEKAEFQIYLFNGNPPWTSNRNITDILDIINPPNRMFSIVYPAKDNRHIVLIQSLSFNKFFERVAGQGQMIYQSPNGFKVWGGPRSSSLGNILLESARGVTRTPASADAIGYILESPAGTYPALGINGTITDEELRTLVDSLAPVSKQEK